MRVLAVPKSMAKSREKRLCSQSSIWREFLRGAKGEVGAVRAPQRRQGAQRHARLPPPDSADLGSSSTACPVSFGGAWTPGRLWTRRGQLRRLSNGCLRGRAVLQGVFEDGVERA